MTEQITKNEKIEVSVSELCENCIEDGNEVLAKFYCKTCKMSYCEKCNDLAHSLTSLKRHKRVAIKNGSFQKNKDLVERTCSKHHKQLKVFCFDCEEVICTKCAFSDHEGHKIKIVEIASKEYKLKNYKLLNETLKRKDHFLVKLENETKTITSRLDYRLKDLQKKKEFLSQRLEKTFLQLKDEITDEEMKKLSMLGDQKQKEEKNVQLLKAAEKNFSRIQSAQRRKDHLEIVIFSILFNKASKITETQEEETLAVVSGPQKQLYIADQTTALAKMTFNTPFDTSNSKVEIDKKFGSIGDPIRILYKIYDSKNKLATYQPITSRCVIKLPNNEQEVISNFTKMQNTSGTYYYEYKAKKSGKYEIASFTIDGEKIAIDNNLAFTINVYSNCWNENKKGERIALSDGNRSARYMGGSGRGKDRQIEGSQIMTQGVHTFRLKVVKLSGCMEFGVKPPQKKGWAYKVGWTFCLDCADKHSLGSSYRFGKKCKTGDVITIIINMDTHTVSYKINDNNLGIAHKNVAKELVLAVGIWGINDQLTFL
ncbi:e3 ubiquitin-protein ligase trim [Anaeramoeba flamelloides]|uniref:E3 ubiquitin-protein ligase trim n=1 Tax=Anaeramoeba flamelloides TaxID=1746091 RepID=A0AAV8A1R4_9EUKA|nr:e3 ubiquitin-protein ligase trim [Anaeramoeba flamelloides]